MNYNRIVCFFIIGLLFAFSVGFPMITNRLHAAENTSMENTNDMNNKESTIYLQHYDEETKTVINPPLPNLTKNQAYIIRDRLQQTQQKFSSTIERMQAQIKILQEYKLLSDDFTLQKYLNMIPGSTDKDRIPTSIQQSTVTPNVIVCGPCITSFLTIGGPLLPLHTLLFGILPPFWYNTSQYEYDLLTGTRIATFVGLLPVIAFYCTATTFINTYGAVIGEQSVFSPFIALMILHAGFGLSMIIYDDAFPVSIFDWSIGVSATGLIAYIQI